MTTSHHVMKSLSTDKKEDLKSAVDEKYIEKLKKQLDTSYPGKDYPEKDLAWAYVKNVKPDERSQQYNPFNLRLPYELTGYEQLYKHTSIIRDERSWDYTALTKKRASTTYFNTLKQFNLAYIQFLQALNESKESLKTIKELFTSKNKIFLKAEVNEDHLPYLSDKIKQKNFPLALLAYLVLNIVFSKDSNITTDARIKTLELTCKEFDIEQVGQAFKDFQNGYLIEDRDEPTYDLIPKKFVTSPEEASGTPQNNIFLTNKKICDIFKISSQSIEFDKGYTSMLISYLFEIAQVLHSFLRVTNYYLIDKKYTFVMLASLHKLDPIQKNKIFGDHASFRKEQISRQGVSSRIDWALGQDSFGESTSKEELDQLSEEALKARLLQYINHTQTTDIELKETNLKLTKAHAELEKMSSYLSQYAYKIQLLAKELERTSQKDRDPKGYFSILSIHPDTPEDLFESILQRNYHKLALRYHPDKGGDAAQFKLLKEAHACFSNLSERMEYCKTKAAPSHPSEQKFK